MSAVGFIGLGIMGIGMANNLVTKAGRSLVVWNRSAAKSAEFAAAHEGCKSVATPREVIAACDITYLMLSDLEASRAVYYGEDGVLAGMEKGKCVVDCATLTPEHMSEVARLVKEGGGSFLEAPVSGSKVPAEQGTLIFLAGGDKDLFERAKADLEVMGKKSVFLGAVGKGSEMKLVVNMVMGTMAATLAEGIALADASGLQAADLLDVLDAGAMTNPLFRMKGPKMVAGDHAPHFPLKHAQKDMRFALGLGDAVGQPLPVAAAANEVFKKARLAHGDEDFSAVYEATKK